MAVTQAVMAMGRSLKLEVVAEGVESAEQSAFLQSIGCEIAQGFYFSAPLVAEQAGELLAQRGQISPRKGTKVK